MSSTKLLFLKPLLTTAQVRLLLNCDLKWISASLTLISFTSIPCASDQVFWAPFHYVNPSPRLPFLSTEEITFYFSEILEAKIGELSISFLSDIKFIFYVHPFSAHSSSLFQSLITFQSQVHPSSSGFHELQSSGRALDSRRFSATCQPRSHPLPHVLISPPPLALSGQANIRLKTLLPWKYFSLSLLFFHVTSPSLSLPAIAKILKRAARSYVFFALIIWTALVFMGDSRSFEIRLPGFSSSERLLSLLCCWLGESDHSFNTAFSSTNLYSFTVYRSLTWKNTSFAFIFKFELLSDKKTCLSYKIELVLMYC